MVEAAEVVCRIPRIFPKSLKTEGEGKIIKSASVVAGENVGVVLSYKSLKSGAQPFLKLNNSHVKLMLFKVRSLLSVSPTLRSLVVRSISFISKLYVPVSAGFVN